MDWKRKLTSRKFWLALAGLVTGIITLLKPGTDTTQITGLILSLGSVIAYIVGEGLVDAAAASISEYTGEPVETLEDASVNGKSNTGTAQAATVKQDTALSGGSGAVASDTTGAK